MLCGAAPTMRCYSSCQRYWGNHGRKKKKKRLLQLPGRKGCEGGDIPVQSWPKAGVGISAVWMHTSPSNTAAAGGPMGWMPAGAHPHWSGMPTALVAGRGVLRGSGTVLRLCPPRDLGAQLQTGPSWSLCGTVCGKAPTRRAPRAKGLVGSIVPAHMAGSAQHRWAFSLWLSREYWKKLRARWGRLARFGNFSGCSLLTGYACLVNGRPRNPVIFTGVCGLTLLCGLWKSRDAVLSFFQWLFPKFNFFSPQMILLFCIIDFSSTITSNHC